MVNLQLHRLIISGLCLYTLLIQLVVMLITGESSPLRALGSNAALIRLLNGAIYILLACLLGVSHLHPFYGRPME